MLCGGPEQSSSRHRNQENHFLTDGSHNPQNTARKRLGWVLAVLAEMDDGNWAHAASESNDFVDYNLIGDSSHNFTELPAAVWAAFVVSHF